MDTIINVPRHIKAYTAALALAALVITLLAVSFSAGPTQAQNATNTYDSPVPCGDTPGTGTASMDEPHELTTGHFALFDAYWERIGDDLDEGAIHINDCPPKMVADRAGILSRAAAAIDRAEAIIHVENTRQATVINSASRGYVPGSVEGPTVDLVEYPAVASAANVGDKVWWLQLDDPDTTDVDETSDLRIGFSAALFDEKYWLKNEENAPMRWMLEAVSFRNIDEANPPHFFAYEAPKKNNARQERAVWDSFRPDVTEHDMMLDPGEYRSLQWIFTGEGSYTIQSQFQGFVRSTNPYGEGEDGRDDWEAISNEYDETSAISEYVFQVGDNLDETEPPMFGVSASVHEDASPGDKVGQPIRVFGAEVDKLIYTLTGTGSDNFGVSSHTHPFAAQVVVAGNANLDYETDSSYDLVLEVSDGKDHEGNIDLSADHSIAVEIGVLQAPRVYLEANKHALKVGHRVNISANVWALPEGVAVSTLSYTLWETSSDGATRLIYLVPDATTYTGTTTESKDSPGTFTYTPTALYILNGVEHRLHGDPVTVTWHK